MVFEDNMNNPELTFTKNDRELKFAPERELACKYDPYICQYYGWRRDLAKGDEDKGEERERNLWDWWGWPAPAPAPEPAPAPAPAPATTSGTCTNNAATIEDLKNYPTQSGSKSGSMAEFWYALEQTQWESGEKDCLPCIQCTLTWDWCNDV